MVFQGISMEQSQGHHHVTPGDAIAALLELRALLRVHLRGRLLEIWWDFWDTSYSNGL